MSKTKAVSSLAKDEREIELKFALTMGDSLSLLEAAPWQALRPGVERRLHSTYFDTQDHRLRQAGFSLRIRDDGAKKTQTVKTFERGDDAFAERGEWSCAVRGMRPNLRARAAAMVRPVLADAALNPEIAPIFTVDVTRHQYDVMFEGATIEVAVDMGEIVAGTRREAFCELELELKDGPKSALFGQAARILRAVPIRLDTQAKAERGFTLLAGGHTVRRAERVMLTPDMPLTAAFQRIARGCLRHFLANESAFWQGKPPEAVHQMRVAIRRLRAAMTAFRPVCDDPLRDRLKSELRWVAGEMGQARELDVYIEGILRDGEAGYGTDPAYRNMVDDYGTRRERAYDQLVLALTSVRFHNLMLTLTQWIECGAWQAQNPPPTDALIAYAACQIKRRWKRVRKIIADHAKLDDTARHAWRIEVKKLRYAVDFFLPLFTAPEIMNRKEAPSHRALKHLTGLQDGLGALNDIAEAERRAGLSEIEVRLIAARAEDRPALLRAIDADCAALAALMPFWKDSNAD